MKRKLFIIIWLGVSCQLLWSQQYIEGVWPGYLKKYNFGFHMGLNLQNLLFSQSAYEENGEVMYVEIPGFSPGFSVGLTGEFRLNKYINLRFSPSLLIGQKKLEFVTSEKGIFYSQTLRSPLLYLPLDVKCNAVRINNYCPYLIGGFFQNLDFGRGKGLPVLLKLYDYGFSMGVGCAVYFPFFKLCPEIRWCFGLRNLLEKNRKDIHDADILRLSKSVSSAKSRMFVITFNIE